MWSFRSQVFTWNQSLDTVENECHRGGCFWGGWVVAGGMIFYKVVRLIFRPIQQNSTKYSHWCWAWRMYRMCTWMNHIRSWMMFAWYLADWKIMRCLPVFIKAIQHAFEAFIFSGSSTSLCKQFPSGITPNICNKIQTSFCQSHLG